MAEIEKVETLEGEYLGFTILTDYIDEQWEVADPALYVCQVKRGALKDIWQPLDRCVNPYFATSMLDQPALEYLRARGVQKIFTPGDGVNDHFYNIGQFLDTKLSWENDNGWQEVKPLEEDRYRPLLASFGIELLFLGDQFSTGQG